MCWPGRFAGRFAHPIDQATHSVKFGDRRAVVRYVTPNVVSLYHSESSLFQSETSFGNRERRRLDRAREKGYLDARRRNSRKLIEPFGLWCWRLKLPMIWMERRTPRSKYGRISVEMFTTANRLTDAGQTAIQELFLAAVVKGTSQISAHSVCCDRVPLGSLDRLARAVLRAITRAGNYELEAPSAGRNAPGASRAATA